MKYPLNVIAAFCLCVGGARSQGDVSAWFIQDEGLADVMAEIPPTREPVVKSIGKSITILGLYGAKQFRVLSRDLHEKGITSKGGLSIPDAPLDIDFDFPLPTPGSIVATGEPVTFNLQSIPNTDLTDVCVKFRELEFKMRGDAKEVLLFVIEEENRSRILIVVKLGSQ